MTYDPFADDEAQSTPANTSTPTDNHWENTTVTTVPQPTTPNPFKIGFTFKAAPGFDAEWLTPTVYGASAQETAERGRDLINAMKETGLLELTHKAAEAVRGGYKGTNTGARGGAGASGASQQRQQGGGASAGKPQGADGAPNGETRSCQHGEMVFRTGFSEKKQATWKGFFCPTPKGTVDQCKAQFLR